MLKPNPQQAIQNLARVQRSKPDVGDLQHFLRYAHCGFSLSAFRAIVVVWSRAAGKKDRSQVSTGDYLDWKRESSAFHTLGVVRGAPFNLSLGEKPEQIAGDYLTPGFLDQLIGDRPFMGRYFTPEEGVAGKDHVAIITHKLWQGYFASDPNIIGKQIHLNGELYTVIGVQPQGQPDRQIVVPFVFSPEQMNHDVRWLVVLGRLK